MSHTMVDIAHNWIRYKTTEMPMYRVSIDNLIEIYHFHWRLQLRKSFPEL